MIGNWLKRKILAAANSAHSGEMATFTLSLRGMSDEELGSLLAGAAMIRCELRKSGVLPDEALGLGMPMDPKKQAFIPLKIGMFAKQLQKNGALNEAAGAMIWLHTMRAITVPELRFAGREMWTQLRRGIPHTYEALTFIEEELRIEVDTAAWGERKFIPEPLMPFDTHG